MEGSNGKMILRAVEDGFAIKLNTVTQAVDLTMHVNGSRAACVVANVIKGLFRATGVDCIVVDPWEIPREVIDALLEYRLTTVEIVRRASQSHKSGSVCRNEAARESPVDVIGGQVRCLQELNKRLYAMHEHDHTSMDVFRRNALAISELALNLARFEEEMATRK